MLASGRPNRDGNLAPLAAMPGIGGLLPSLARWSNEFYDMDAYDRTANDGGLAIRPHKIRRQPRSGNPYYQDAAAISSPAYFLGTASERHIDSSQHPP